MGCGTKKDVPKALDLYYKAASKGFINSIISMARIYENGADGIEKNIEASKKWYAEAAIRGDEKSQ